ncbi:hypothetical protein PtrSN002B_008593 [Pyrenophora tritici-repentis]|uniref:Uncharacterized protein n=2 Tax=Pyrenophora tritici-repentis TaxID=45151 RepID=A0A2W1DJ61_9PLEO|nr:uncharacterized protein PTRG_06027 [Pyrenophora tritici-repentis Pt-1C-BFP]KAA8619161.1 hypothetical protein PtrV1_08590 [Pyrenophora tritici-repentis]EDU48947.1 predicted protein [Pyrenophora tritici-repentis Pt-1C-BFP]KAF7449632.1 hypothetical protein A1F99_066810 [Pyrenophora tritici-repentis]KAF7570247.1 hypothetical protein PtrM4_102490 [Pyrenophora tritici-repentis]KAG9383435.1 hypothetical protein A1F94_005346 [Pyrenophora tritici-repentis]
MEPPAVTVDQTEPRVPDKTPDIVDTNRVIPPKAKETPPCTNATRDMEGATHATLPDTKNVPEKIALTAKIDQSVDENAAPPSSSKNAKRTGRPENTQEDGRPTVKKASGRKRPAAPNDSDYEPATPVASAKKARVTVTPAKKARNPAAQTPTTKPKQTKKEKEEVEELAYRKEAILAGLFEENERQLLAEGKKLWDAKSSIVKPKRKARARSDSWSDDEDPCANNMPDISWLMSHPKSQW